MNDAFLVAKEFKNVSRDELTNGLVRHLIIVPALGALQQLLITIDGK